MTILPRKEPRDRFHSIETKSVCVCSSMINTAQSIVQLLTNSSSFHILVHLTW